MTSVASEATGDEYEQKRDILRNLVQLWSKNKTCMVIEVLETDQVDDYIHISTLENICRNEKLVSEHSERKTEENNEDEGEMETERDTTELEETLLDNDKQP